MLGSLAQSGYLNKGSKMIIKTFQFPAEVGIILDRVVKIGGTGLKALGSVEEILSEYVLYHLCVVLKSKLKATCKNETKIGGLEYETLASLEHVIDTFSTDGAEEFFDLLEGGEYKSYRMIKYENVNGYTNVTVELE